VGTNHISGTADRLSVDLGGWSVW